MSQTPVLPASGGSYTLTDGHLVQTSPPTASSPGKSARQASARAAQPSNDPIDLNMRKPRNKE